MGEEQGLRVCKIHIRGGTYAERQQRANAAVGMVFGTDLDLGPVRIIPDQLLPLFTVNWPKPKISMTLKRPPLGPVAQVIVTEQQAWTVTAERAEIWLDSRNMGGALVMDLDSLRALAAWEDACGIKYA